MLKITIHLYMMKENFNTCYNPVPRERRIERTEKYFPQHEKVHNDLWSYAVHNWFHGKIFFSTEQADNMLLYLYILYNNK